MCISLEYVKTIETLWIQDLGSTGLYTLFTQEERGGVQGGGGGGEDTPVYEISIQMILGNGIDCGCGFHLKVTKEKSGDRSMLYFFR